jgi:hypothetical protein
VQSLCCARNRGFRRETELPTGATSRMA